MYRNLLVAFISLSILGCTESVEHSKLPANRELKVSITACHDNVAQIKFVNHSDLPIRLLRPLERSWAGWAQPHYRVAISDGGNERVATSAYGCGNFSAPERWDEYLVVLPPGESFQISSDLLTPPQEGEYEITFEYIFETKGNIPANGTTPFPKELWKGRVKSKPFKSELKYIAPMNVVG